MVSMTQNSVSQHPQVIYSTVMSLMWSGREDSHYQPPSGHSRHAQPICVGCASQYVVEVGSPRAVCGRPANRRMDAARGAATAGSPRGRAADPCARAAHTPRRLPVAARVRPARRPLFPERSTAAVSRPRLLQARTAGINNRSLPDNDRKKSYLTITGLPATTMRRCSQGAAWADGGH